MSQEALVRFEVEVAETDAGLIKGVVAALADPHRRSQARRSLRSTFSVEASAEREAGPARDLKALLASPLLQGVDLERPSDGGRNVNL